MGADVPDALDDALHRLTSLVEAGDRAGVVRLAAELTEEHRLALSPRLRPLVQRVSREHWDAVWLPGGASGAVMDRITAASVAEAVTAPISEVASVITGWHEDLDVLALRPPAWRRAWARVRTENRSIGLVYLAARAGLVERPTGPDWVLGLLRGLPVDTTLADAIAADPVLLERDLWELFETEGGGQDSLANRDKYSPADEGPWAVALKALADRGVIDRGRLLDASLASLARDLPLYQAGWFSAFHELLEPTVDERARRQAAYARLLRSPIGPTVSFAVRALRAVRRAGRVDDDVLQAHLAPALLARAKTTAIGSLTLLEGCAAPDPELARAATEHPAAEVQVRAIRLLARLGAAVDPEGLAPRLRAVPVDDDGSVPALPARRDVDPRAPRDLVPLLPVTDAADLAERLAVLAERLDDPDEMDLVVDAAVRLGPSSQVQAALAPLVRAARRRLVDVHEESPGTTVVRALIVAVEEPGSPLVQQLRGSTLAWADVLPRVGAGGLPPLGTPTHAGGWLDVHELARRLAVHGDVPAAELVGALERVPPWQSAELADLPLPEHPFVARTLSSLLSRTSAEYRVRRGKSGEVVVDGPDVLFVDRWPHEDVAVRRDAHARPGRKEGHYASGVGALGTNRDWWEARWNDRLFLEPLLDPNEPFGPMARLLLATAMATKEAAQRRLAVDVVIQAVGDGRLDTDALAEGLVGAAAWTAPARLAGTFEEAASAGPLQALVVRRAGLAVLPEHDPAARGLSALLEILLDLCTLAGAAVEGPARPWLGRLTGSSKAARAATALLAVEGRGTAHQRAAVEQAEACRPGVGAP